jgi:hypothetical protein
LLAEEANVLHLGDRRFLNRRDEHKSRHGPAFEQVFFDQVRDISDLQLLVENSLRPYD